MWKHRRLAAEVIVSRNQQTLITHTWHISRAQEREFWYLHNYERDSLKCRKLGQVDSANRSVAQLVHKTVS